AYCVERLLIEKLRLDMSLFGMGTPVYRKAQWSATAATAALVAGSAALLVWLVARMARALLGLPRARTELSVGWRATRAVVAVPVMVLLVLWSFDEVGLRGSLLAPDRALEAGLALCLMFAYDVPHLMRNGLAALGGRRGLVGARACPLGQLPPTGLVRTAGTVMAAGKTLETPDGPAVYVRTHVRTYTDPDDARGPVAVEVVPFYLDDGSVRVQVDPG